MSNINLHPLFRRSIGFDRLNDFIDYAMQSDAPNYPPYNIEKHGEPSWFYRRQVCLSQAA